MMLYSKPFHVCSYIIVKTRTCSDRWLQRQRLQLPAADVHGRAVCAVRRVRELHEQVVRRVEVVARRDLRAVSTLSQALSQRATYCERDGADDRWAVHALEEDLGLVPVIVLVHAQQVLGERGLDTVLRGARVVSHDLDRLYMCACVSASRTSRRGRVRTSPATSGFVELAVTTELPNRLASGQDWPSAVPARPRADTRMVEVRMTRS
jgi:hypothetical protein